mgnify:CR=1 FL=1
MKRTVFVYCLLVIILALSGKAEAQGDCSKGVRCGIAIDIIKDVVSKTGLSKCPNQCPEAIMHAMLYQESSCNQGIRLHLGMEGTKLINACQRLRGKFGFKYKGWCDEQYQKALAICNKVHPGDLAKCKVSADFEESWLSKS